MLCKRVVSLKLRKNIYKKDWINNETVRDIAGVYERADVEMVWAMKRMDEERAP